MKKVFYPLLAIVLSILPLFANAQCTVSPHTLPGFYPTPQEGIHPAAATDYYALNVTVVIPADTFIQPFGTVAIDSMTIKEFIGFPSSFQYYYNTPSQYVKGNTSGCMLIHGTPAVADIGIHNISLVFTAMIFGFAYTDTVDGYWQFEVKDASHIAVEQPGEQTRAIAIYPNPARDVLEFNAPVSSLHKLAIYDVSGRMIQRIEEDLAEGENLRVSLEQFKAGIYMVRIENLYGTTTQKISVIR
ncbi:MAG: T9SS type A sorting domain-containing protein [Bacteroidales bacterium]